MIVALALLLLPKFFSLKISLLDALLVLQLPCAQYSGFLVIVIKVYTSVLAVKA